MTQPRRKHLPLSRYLCMVVVLLIGAVALTACSSESSSDEAATGTEQSQESDSGGESADAGEQPEGDGEVDQAGVEALATFGLIEGALRVRAEQGPLDQQDLDETFGDFDPYADKLPAETKADYQTYHDAAVSAIGLEDAEVDAILDAAEVQAAIGGLTQMSMMSACMS